MTTEVEIAVMKQQIKSLTEYVEKLEDKVEEKFDRLDDRLSKEGDKQELRLKTFRDEMNDRHDKSDAKLDLLIANLNSNSGTVRAASVATKIVWAIAGVAMTVAGWFIGNKH